MNTEARRPENQNVGSPIYHIKKGNKTAERKCRVCGCTEDDCRQCYEKTGGPCHWVAPDLCSACEEDKK